MESLITFGASVKALGGGKVGGYLVLFSSSKDPDLAKDYFNSETDFDISDGAKSAVYFNHGLDPELKTRKLSEGVLSIKDAGVWVQTQLNLRDEYESAIYTMAKSGKLGWSSGTASHLVEREAKEGSNWIKRWPLGLDASLTPTPCEPRTSAVPLKSINVVETFDSLKSGLTTREMRDQLTEAIEDVIGECWVEEYDDTNAYAYSYSGMWWSVPYSSSRGKLTLGTPEKVTPKTIYVSSTKSISGETAPHGETFADLTAKTLGAIREFVDRAKAYASLKSESGRPISKDRESDFKQVRTELDEVLRLSPSAIKNELLIEQLRLEHSLLDLN